jgi:hypothetical protein
MVRDWSANWAGVWESDGLEFDPTCGRCGLMLENRPGGRRLPLRLKIPSGKRYGDVWFLGPEILVNEHAKQVLLKHVHSGVSFVEAEIAYPAGVRLWSVEVSNRCVMHPDCNVEIGPICAECGRRRHWTWDGGIRLADCTHDMFRLIEFSGKVFVSESLKKSLEAEGLKNVAFVDAASIYDENAKYLPTR